MTQTALQRDAVKQSSLCAAAMVVADDGGETLGAPPDGSEAQSGVERSNGVFHCDVRRICHAGKDNSLISATMFPTRDSPPSRLHA